MTKKGKYKGVPIFMHEKDELVFIDCNLINCEVPKGSIVKGCNTAIILYEKGKIIVYGKYTEKGKLKYLDKPKSYDVEEDIKLTQEEMLKEQIYIFIKEYESHTKKKFVLEK